MFVPSTSFPLSFLPSLPSAQPYFFLLYLPSLPSLPISPLPLPALPSPHFSPSLPLSPHPYSPLASHSQSILFPFPSPHLVFIPFFLSSAPSFPFFLSPPSFSATHLSLLQLVNRSFKSCRRSSERVKLPPPSPPYPLPPHPTSLPHLPPPTTGLTTLPSPSPPLPGPPRHSSPTGATLLPLLFTLNYCCYALSLCYLPPPSLSFSSSSLSPSLPSLLHQSLRSSSFFLPFHFSPFFPSFSSATTPSPLPLSFPQSTLPSLPVFPPSSLPSFLFPSLSPPTPPHGHTHIQTKSTSNHSHIQSSLPPPTHAHNATPFILSRIRPKPTNHIEPCQHQPRTPTQAPPHRRLIPPLLPFLHPTTPLRASGLFPHSSKSCDNPASILYPLRKKKTRLHET
ncbi:hypothetical protein C7M84_009154 [Penaeus vannamei]|uniref:Uncharacterized protein n=1 Tax=Penaeus vannamei TaxID=6689 RepID=A0A423T7P0_PENVA|nr:hypothetical protein C7M84_009154 [Penaeus vannamei]